MFWDFTTLKTLNLGAGTMRGKKKKIYESINNYKFNNELHLLNLEGDALRNSHTNGGPKDAVSTDLPFSTVLHHSSKKT